MSEDKTNWQRELETEFKRHDEDISKMKCTLSDNELLEPFYDGFGGTNGKPFTAWGEKWVYFPICYDGSEWVGSAPRDPCDISLEHQGGG